MKFAGGWRFVCAWGVALQLLGCAPRLDDPERFQALDCASFDVPRDLFAARCATSECHDAHEPAAGMDLVSGGVEERLAGVEASTCVGRRRIDPHAPEASVLLHRVSPDPTCHGATVNRMPLEGPPLSEREQTCLEAWIDEVAARNQDRVMPLGDGGSVAPDASSPDAGDDAAVPPVGDAG